MTVKVRFAPSPTGNLHIGSARTALFNYLFARHHGGKFVLRIEDTDQERSTKAFEQDILEGLAWLGYTSDEPIVYQNSRRDLHMQYVEQLLQKGLAYKDPEGSPAIFFKVPKTGQTVIPDLVKGDIVFQNEEFKDQVLLKSDGSVTYNFAVVLDDALMGITHIIRGEDHISNTPKQIFLYEALGFPLPKFAHIPMILGPDRSKLSKRHGATSIRDYRAQGFTAEAINNYLALLGWTPADGAELMNLQELIAKFDLDRASKSNSIFDLQKLTWMNGQKLKVMDPEKIITQYNSFLPEGFKEIITQNKLKAVEMVKAIQDSLELVTDLKQLEVFLPGEIDLTAELGTLQKPESKTVFSLFSQKFKAGLSLDDAQSSILDAIVKETGFKKGQVLHPLRFALTGRTKGPGLKFIITLLDPDIITRRINNALGC
jgi:glutamyl-tRNA synthetase